MFNREKSDQKRVPMMPVREMVIFPGQMTPFIVGREGSVRALEDALAGDKRIFLATQHDASIDDPKPDDIYTVGTIANIVQSVKLPEGNIRVLVEGIERAKVVEVTTNEGFFRATLRLVTVKSEPFPQLGELISRVTTLFEQYVKLSQAVNYDTVLGAARVEDPGRLSDAIAANVNLPFEEKQELLEMFDPVERLQQLGKILDVELEKLNVERNINSRVKRQMERAQKEYYLNEKMKAIQKELGRGEKSEIDELRKKIETSGMPKDAREKANQELKRLEMMPPMSAESTVSRNYLDWLLAVPWKKEIQGNSRHHRRRIHPRKRSLRPRKNQGTHPGISGCAPTGEESKRLHSVLRRPSGRWQNFAGHFHRPRHGTQVRPRFPGRSPRRGRNPRSSPHLHRRASRPDYPDDEEGRHGQSDLRPRRSGQDVHGFPRRSFRRA